MRILIQTMGAIAVLFFTSGFGPVRPEVPESLKAPAGEEVILMAQAAGVQIYVCQAETQQKSAWVLKAPEAELDRRNWEADRASLRGTGMEAHRWK